MTELDEDFSIETGRPGFRKEQIGGAGAARKPASGSF